MSTRWTSSSTPQPRRRPQHTRLKLARWRRPLTVLRDWEAEHGLIGASPRPGRHRYVQLVDEQLVTRHDTVAMPMVTAFVPLAGAR